MKILRLLMLIVVICVVNCKPVNNTIENDGREIGIRRKRLDDGSVYLEQCAQVKFSNVRKGFVNVLAFLDPSWPYSHRQALMLNMLKERLEKSGLLDTVFFIVNSNPMNISSRVVDTDEEDDIEREAWLGISRDEIERLYDDEKLFSLKNTDNSEIETIQDNDELQIWKRLGVSRDQILVIDRCGRLTYQVIVPWSILHFPYVKAAILSTYKDEPCGTCNVANYFPHNDISPSTTINIEQPDTTIFQDLLSHYGEEANTEENTEDVLTSTESSTRLYDEVQENEETTIWSVVDSQFSTDREVEVTTGLMELENNYFQQQFLNVRQNSFDPVVTESTVAKEEMEEITKMNNEQTTSFPIRIIMHAPHFHTDTDSARMHEYVVLRTTNPKVHQHLASQDATRLYSELDDFWEEIPDAALKLEIEEKIWTMNNVIFKKEGTGLLNEVPDYSWKDISNLENYQDLLEENYKTDEPHTFYENVDEKSTSDTSSQILTEAPPEEMTTEEEETRNKVIAHYSKLLPWIYYVLDE